MTDRIEFEPQPPKDTAWQRLMIGLGLARRNRGDKAQAKAAERNAAVRRREDERRRHQPGGQR